MKKKVISGGLILLLLCCLAAARLFPDGGRQENGTEITIYLDPSNEMYVRNMIAAYDHYSRVARNTGETDQYPEITWKLVDKSGLSAGAYRSQLISELESGGGPDLVFLDAYSCENPLALVQAQYFIDLNAFLDGEASQYNPARFLPGTLEAGQWEGGQYLLPVSMEVPVLCTTRERLKEAGFSPEELTGTESILAAAANYGEKTGKSPFSSWDFLEDLDIWIGAPETWTDSVKRSVEILRSTAKQRTGKEESLIRRTASFCAGDCLFLTEGMEDRFSLKTQLMLLPEEEEVVFLPLNRLDGKIQGRITQSLAVNQNTSNPKLSLAALNAFSEELAGLAEDLPTGAGKNWNTILTLVKDGTCEYVNNHRESLGSHLSSHTAWNYLKATKQAVETAVYGSYKLPGDEGDKEQGSSGILPEEETGQAANGRQSPQTLSVLLEETGSYREDVIYLWLDDSAKQFERETGIHVELILSEPLNGTNLAMLGEAGLFPDIWVLDSFWADTMGKEILDQYMAAPRELSNYDALLSLDWREEARATLENGSLPVIPYLLTPPGQVQTWGFCVAKASSSPDTALRFLAACLQNEAYDSMAELVRQAEPGFCGPALERD